MLVHDGNKINPHAHLLLTVRPLNDDGTWQYKTEKEYLCVKNNIERGFTAEEYKSARKDGWVKQYPYKVDGKKVYLPPSVAEAAGYKRMSKYPKSTRYGRQNPITERWNSEEQLVVWRRAWADVVNCELERLNYAERIDHRSHAERGLLEKPTIHEGVISRMMEQEGKISERCEINRQIRTENKMIREIKKQITKLSEKLQNSIPVIAESLENIRVHLILLQYRLLSYRLKIEGINDTLNPIAKILKEYIRKVPSAGLRNGAISSN